MLPGCSSGVDKALIVSRLKIVRERAADLPQDLEWSDGLGPGVGVLQQRGERFAGVGVGDRTSRLHPMRLSMEVSNATSCAVREGLDNVHMPVTTRRPLPPVPVLLTSFPSLQTFASSRVREA